jgi:hypothetical protein
MNVLDLTVDQLKRAVALKEQIDKLNKELGSILGGATSGTAPAKTPTMSDAVKKKIAATQKARWAKLQGSKPAPLPVEPAAVAIKKPSASAFATTSVAAKPATLPVKTAAKPNKTNVSAATRAKLSRKLKAFWAAKKAGKK